MTTYTLVVEVTAGGRREAKAYSTASNAIDDMRCGQAGGAMVSAILRDGQPIDEPQLWAEGAVGKAIDIGLGACGRCVG